MQTDERPSGGTCWDVRFSGIRIGPEDKGFELVKDDGKPAYRVRYCGNRFLLPVKFGRQIDAERCADWLNNRLPIRTICREEAQTEIVKAFGTPDNMLREMLTECLAW